jgi:hypothetical protein
LLNTNESATVAKSKNSRTKQDLSSCSLVKCFAGDVKFTTKNSTSVHI